MKKSLFAVAAATAFAGAAQAQSSVTVYGILDVGYINSSQSIPSAVAGAPNQKTSSSAFGQSAETTSRLGFRGTEDLGGGTRAFFTAEFQLYPNDESLSGSTSESLITGAGVNPVAANGGLLNRQAFVGLGQKGIGQAAIGTQYTPAFNLGARMVAGQYNNIVGSTIYAANGSGTINASYTNRLANTLTVQSDTFAGFNFNAMYSMNSNTQNQRVATGGTLSAVPGTNDNTAWGVGANYRFQKLDVGVAYQSIKNEALTGATSAGAASASAAVASGSNYTGTNVTSNELLVGANYDFGILKAYAAYSNRKVSSNLNSNQYLKRSAQEIGVRGNITKTVAGWASIGTGRLSAFGEGQPTANFNGWQLGSDYILSKRTNLYAIYGKNQTSSTTTTSVSPNGLAGSISQFAVGVRHTF
jgi:predicted porin